MLVLNHLCGFGAGSTASGPVLTYIGAASSSTDNASSYTFTSQNIGTASADRDVIVAIATILGDAIESITSVTFGGTAATQLIQATEDDTTVGRAIIVGMARLRIASGTTSTIVVNLSQAVSRAIGIDVWTLTGHVDGTPSATATDSGEPASFALNVPSVGLVASCGYHDSGPGTVSWTNASEQTETVIDTYCGKSSAYTASQNLTITADWSGASHNAMVGMAW